MREYSEWKGCSFVLIILFFQALRTCIILSAAKIPLCLCWLIKKNKRDYFPHRQRIFHEGI